MKKNTSAYFPNILIDYYLKCIFLIVWNIRPKDSCLSNRMMYMYLFM